MPLVERTDYGLGRGSIGRSQGQGSGKKRDHDEGMKSAHAPKLTSSRAGLVTRMRKKRGSPFASVAWRLRGRSLPFVMPGGEHAHHAGIRGDASAHGVADPDTRRVCGMRSSIEPSAWTFLPAPGARGQ